MAIVLKEAFAVLSDPLSCFSYDKFVTDVIVLTIECKSDTTEKKKPSMLFAFGNPCFHLVKIWDVSGKTLLASLKGL
ncbi:hypothetical protein HanPI659440_Chr03g0116291 [Helianthus annuus]|nr:hypothetical protein HanPI659440_Chr03g0116291 [Helianthus annuus]